MRPKRKKHTLKYYQKKLKGLLDAYEAACTASKFESDNGIETDPKERQWERVEQRVDIGAKVRLLFLDINFAKLYWGEERIVIPNLLWKTDCGIQSIKMMKWAHHIHNIAHTEWYPDVIEYIKNHNNIRTLIEFKNRQK